VTRRTYVDVTKLYDLRESYVTLFQVAGRPVILTRVGDAIHAFDGICTHAEFQFATSRLVNGCEIECPMHGACFDAETGEVTHGPAELPLHSIDVQVEDGVVRLCVDWADASDPV
jgi:3-phenylpropionate/trans-cinnamate dioxygenase ferredoxin component